MTAISNVFRGILKYLLLICNILAVLWLGLCYAAAVYSPETLPNIELFTLTTPFAIIANALLAIIWLCTKSRWLSLISFVSLLLCCRIVCTVFGLNFLAWNDTVKKPGTFKVLSWNVHGMGIYADPDNDHARRIMDLVYAENPDIFCATEYFVQRTDSSMPYTPQIIKDNHFKEFKLILDNSLGTQLLMGTAIFSKFPIKATKVYQLAEYIFLLQCDVEVRPGKIIRVFAMHLCSFMLTEEDRDYMASIKNKKAVSGSDLWRAKRLMWKFNYDYWERAHEADQAAAIISKSPYPVVICGDFNDLPASYTYTTVKGNLNDAFAQKGIGLGRTFNQIFPTLRIDHLLYSPDGLKLLGYKCHTIYGFSDHSPIMANFDLSND